MTRSPCRSDKSVGLEWIAQHWETANADVDRHIKGFRDRLSWQAELGPYIQHEPGDSLPVLVDELPY